MIQGLTMLSVFGGHYGESVKFSKIGVLPVFILASRMPEHKERHEIVQAHLIY
jgi:hypothetical protein